MWAWPVCCKQDRDSTELKRCPVFQLTRSYRCDVAKETTASPVAALVGGVLVVFTEQADGVEDLDGDCWRVYGPWFAPNIRGAQHLVNQRLGTLATRESCC
jgi:hypothetical protein